MSGASAWQVFVWVAVPYLALGIFVVGHIWRWRYDQFGWTSRSTQLQERRLLKWGSPLFHYGTFAAIAGHVIGILRRCCGPPPPGSRSNKFAMPGGSRGLFVPDGWGQRPGSSPCRSKGRRGARWPCWKACSAAPRRRPGRPDQGSCSQACAPARSAASK